ncbi:MAG: tyrosine-type recombinase/integrase, partial [Pseudonocardiaceae bacterium]
GQGRLLSAATVQRVLAATSSFFEWAIAAEVYAAADNPMQKRADPALARVVERHQPFVGAASRQQPVRRTVRVRLPIRLPRPLTDDEVQALLESMITLRDLAIFLLMLDGGLRPGEVLCLQLQDVSYGHRRVTIRKRDDHPRGARAKARRDRVTPGLLPINSQSGSINVQDAISSSGSHSRRINQTTGHPPTRCAELAAGRSFGIPGP